MPHTFISMPFSVKKVAEEKPWNFPQGPVNLSSFMHSHFELQEPFKNFSAGITLALAFILSAIFLSDHFQTARTFYS